MSYLYWKKINYNIDFMYLEIFISKYDKQVINKTMNYEIL